MVVVVMVVVVKVVVESSLLLGSSTYVQCKRRSQHFNTSSNVIIQTHADAITTLHKHYTNENTPRSKNTISNQILVSKLEYICDSVKHSNHNEFFIVFILLSFTPPQDIGLFLLHIVFSSQLRGCNSWVSLQWAHLRKVTTPHHTTHAPFPTPWRRAEHTNIL